MRPAVVVFPGINRERDMARTLRLIVGREPAMVWHAETTLPPGTDLVVIPGGFSYGDYLRCGAIARFSPVMAAVADFARQGGPVLGICNGFQVLCEAGLLPGALLRNAGLRFVCREVDVTVASGGKGRQRVRASNPGAGTPVERGATVRLLLRGNGDGKGIGDNGDGDG